MSDIEFCREEVNRLNLKLKRIDPVFGVHRDLELLAPREYPKFVMLYNTMQRLFREKKTRSKFEVFETYRTPQRQRYLFKLPERVTKADAFESAHNFGLAADFVPRDPDGTWSWDANEDWDLLEVMAKQSGLSAPLKWDRPHVQSLLWPGVHEAMT